MRAGWWQGSAAETVGLWAKAAGRQCQLPKLNPVGAYNQHFTKWNTGIEKETPKSSI